MKKIMAGLSAMFVLACGMMMTGCELDDTLEDIVGPKNKWCKKTFDYSNDTTTSKLTCYFYYTEEAVTDSKLRDGIEIPAGLTVVAIASTNDANNILSGNKYVIKTLKQGEKITDDAADNVNGKLTMNSALWTAICVLNPSIPSSAKSTIPAAINKDSDVVYTELTDMSNFSWKNILAQILIDKLLEEDTE